MEINELKGVYSGRAFLLGNGASLNNAPFDLLKNEYTFAVNRIAMIFDDTDWRPAFYVGVSTSIDDPRFHDWKDDVYRALDESQLVFMCSYLHDSIGKPLADKIVRLECQHTSHIEINDALDGFWYDDLMDGVSKYGASLLAAAQIAVYLGFSPLYFIGLDGYGRGADNFSDNYRNEQQAIDDAQNAAQQRAFQIVKANCDRLGVEVYLSDVSHGYGVFDKVSFDEIFRD